MSARRDIIRFAIPVSLQLVCQHSISLLTQVFVAALSDGAVAATGLAAQLSGIALIGLSSLGSAASIKLSRLQGSEQTQESARVMWRALVLALLFGLMAAFVLLIGAPWCLAALGVQKNVAPLAIHFVRMIAVSIPFLAISETCSHLLRARGDSRTPMLVGLLAVGIDCALSATLIPGRWGFPLLGLQGAALAVIGSRLGAALILLGITFRALWRLDVGLWDSLKDWAALWTDLIQPSGFLALGHGAWVLGMTAYAAVYSWLGTSPFAAIQIVQQIESVGIMFSVGFCAACLSFVGQALGRGDETETQRVISDVLKMVAVLSVLASCSMATLTLVVQRLYPKLTTETSALVVSGLLFSALIVPVKIYNMVLATGVLRTGGDVRFVTLCELMMAVGIACSYVLGLNLQLGLLGALAGKAIEEMVKLFLFVHRYRSALWIHKL